MAQQKISRDDDRAWISIGAFDGVHSGHQQIIGVLSSGVKETKSKAIAVTFYPHPLVYFKNPSKPFYLSTVEEKNMLLKAFGAGSIVTFKFDQPFSRLSPREFINRLYKQAPFSHLLIGYDFRMGANRAGDHLTLQQLGEEMNFSVEIIAPVLHQSKPISSSRIRSALEKGELDLANIMLGYPYFISGEVVRGDGRGRHIGLPTANLSPWPQKLIPAPGVYAAFTEVKDVKYQSVVSIGYRPTFYESPAMQTIETHILDYSNAIYGEKIRIHFINRLRSEKKYDSVDSLMAQIKWDIINAKEILSDAAKTSNIPA